MDEVSNGHSRIIRNPVLPGFHPDPCILRVGEEYFIANSTFEWFPGVQISSSHDLMHWNVRSHCLTRPSQLDLRGTPRSGGVWAPSLAHDGEQFLLAFTHVKHWGFGFDDCHNFVVTAPSIEGPWSEPVYLRGGGFDPSIFIDHDGTKWFLQMLWDHHPSRDHFAGIVLQQFSEKELVLIEKPKLIFRGSPLGRTEGPHLYRHGGYYYLMVAEGGTGLDHAVTVARSKRIDGPYEADPAGPLLTSKDAPQLTLQKAGHGSLVKTQSDEWYLAHLCARPVGPARRCVLGRETALQPIEWTEEGWPRLAGGGRQPRVEVPAPRLESVRHDGPSERDDFDTPQLGKQYQTLRIPADERWLSLTARPGYLRLRGMESPQSLHSQSVVARRFGSFFCRFETCLEFFPENFQQMAGLICLYDDQNFYYAYVGFNDRLGRIASVMKSCSGALKSGPEIPMPMSAPSVYLRAEYRWDTLDFFVSFDGDAWTSLSSGLDATILSDEHTTAGLGFTGAFGAICAHDMSGAGLAADFDYFEYRDLDEQGPELCTQQMKTSSLIA